MVPQQEDTPVIGRDIAWEDVREKICRVVSFVPQEKFEQERVSAIRATWGRLTPYGSITVECEGLSGEALIFITHRIDYRHLWEAFAQRNEENGEEVIVAHVPARFRLFRGALPKLVVYLCPKGAFAKMTKREPMKPGEAGWREIAPIAKWGGELT